MLKTNLKNTLKKIFCSSAFRAVLLVGVIGIMIFPVTAFAQSTSDVISNPEVDKIMNGLFALSSKIQEFLHSILWWVLLAIGALLQNDILYGGPMEAKLMELWVYIRDIVNVLFVLILVGIAFYNVVRGSDESFQIKAILPKFVTALIVVNFSFLGIKVVLDAVNIVATGLFALPNVVQESLQMTGETERNFCESIYGRGQVYEANLQKAKGNVMCTLERKINYNNPQVFEYFRTYNSRNAALALALNLQKIDLLSKVNVPPEQQKVDKLVINSMFAVVFYIIYATAFVALMCVLLVRLVVLWLMIVLSPLMALMMVLPDSIKGNLGGGLDIGKEFIKHAIVPIPVALVMSIGFIMLKTFEKTTFSDSTLAFETLNVNLLISGFSTMQQFIAAVGTVAFIWKGVFEAMKDTYAQGAVDAISGFVKESAGTLGKLPTMIPLFPVGDNKKVSLAEMMRVPSALRGRMEEITQSGFSDKFKDLAGGPADAASELSRMKGWNDRAKDALRKGYDYRKTPTMKDGLVKYLEENKGVIPPAQIPGGNMENFIKQIKEGGGFGDEMIDQFYEKNGLIPKGTEGPKPGVKAGEAAAGVAGAGAAAGTAAAAGNAASLAEKHHINSTALTALGDRSKYEDILNLQADPNNQINDTEKKKLDELWDALQSNNEEAVTKLLEGEDGKVVKGALAKIENARRQQFDFTTAVGDKNTALSMGQFQDKPNENVNKTKYFEDIENLFKEQFQKLTGKDFDPQGLDPKKPDAVTVKAVERIKQDKAPFQQSHLAAISQATGFENSLAQAVLKDDLAKLPANQQQQPPKK